MASFTAAEFQRKAAEQRPWRSRPSTAGSSASGARRAARAQVKPLTGERSEMLQAYLSAQLSNITDDSLRESISLGMSVSADNLPVGSGLAAVAAASAESRRGRGTSRPGSRAASLSSLEGQELLDALRDERARPLDPSEQIIPGDEHMHSRPTSCGTARSVVASSMVGSAPLVERWPGQKTKPKRRPVGGAPAAGLRLPARNRAPPASLSQRLRVAASLSQRLLPRRNACVSPGALAGRTRSG